MIKFCWMLSLIFVALATSFSPPRFTLPPHTPSSSPSSSHSHQVEAELLKWAASEGAIFPKLGVKSFVTSDGREVRGVVALEDVKAGEMLAEFDPKFDLGHENALKGNLGPVFQEIFSNPASRPWQANPALVLLHEKSLGKQSYWYTYIQSIPSDFHIPLHVSDHLLSLLGQKGAESQQSQMAEFRACWEFFQEVVAKKYRSVFSIEKFTREEVLWAFSAVQTRSFESRDGQGRRITPVLDLFNHHCTRAQISRYESLEVTHLFADRDIKAGEQVYLSYGKYTNMELFLTFGFFDPQNECDKLSFRFQTQWPQPHETESLRVHEEAATGTDFHANFEGIISANTMRALRLHYLVSFNENVVSKRDRIFGNRLVSVTNELFVVRTLLHAIHDRLSLAPLSLDVVKDRLSHQRLSMDEYNVYGVLLADLELCYRTRNLLREHWLIFLEVDFNDFGF